MFLSLVVLTLVSANENPQLARSAPYRHARLVGNESHQQLVLERNRLLRERPPMAGWAVMSAAGIVTGVGFLGVSGLFTVIVAGSDSLSWFGLMLIIGPGLLGMGAALVAVIGVIRLVHAIAEREAYDRELDRAQRALDEAGVQPPQTRSTEPAPMWILARF